MAKRIILMKHLLISHFTDSWPQCNITVKGTLCNLPGATLAATLAPSLPVTPGTKVPSQRQLL